MVMTDTEVLPSGPEPRAVIALRSVSWDHMGFRSSRKPSPCIRAGRSKVTAL